MEFVGAGDLQTHLSGQEQEILMWDTWKLSCMLLTFIPPRGLNILSLLTTMAYWVLTMHESQV